MKKRIILGIGILLALLSLGAFATNARIVWTPQKFNPWSIAPGESASYRVIFTNTGVSSLNTKQVTFEIGGDVKSFLSIASASFPQVIKKGETGEIILRADIPESTPIDPEVTGTLSLVSTTGKKLLFSDTLPISLTISHIPLPPDPGEAGKETVEGIDSDGNGVRDDMQRKIAFMFPDSEKKRAVLMEGVKRNQVFLLGNYPEGEEGKMKAWTNVVMKGKADYCSTLLFGTINAPYEMLEELHNLQKELDTFFLNTPARARQHHNAWGHIGGKALPRVPNDDERLQQCLDVGINPDSFAN